MKHRQAPPPSKFELMAKRFAALEAENRRLSDENTRLRRELEVARAANAQRSSLLDGVDAGMILSVNAWREK